MRRGAEGSGRADDNIESLQKRFNIYLQETKPIIDYYNTLNLVERIDASNGPNEVFEEIQNIFKAHNLQSQ